MKKFICIMLTALMCISLTACGGSGTSGSTGNSSGSSESGTIHRDTLTVAIQREPKSLIPYESNDTGTDYTTSQVYETLIKYDDDLNMIPGLAESWEQVDDTHYRFHLRENVKFHNGDDFTADDVLYTFQQIVNSKAAASTMGPIDIENCKIEDNHTIVIALTKAYPAFLRLCTLPISSIVCKEAMEKDPEGYAKNPIGTGPFKFVEWVSGDHLTYSVNTDWWGGTINYDKLILRYIPEATTRAVEAESGGVDIAQIAVSDAQSVDSNNDVSLVTEQILNTTYLSFNCSIEPFNNVKVRQAISLAIDSDAIVKATYYGYANTAKSFMASSMWGYYDADSEYSGYNVEKAKELMKEAGYENGFSCSLVTYNNQSMAEMIQSYLAEIGITVTLNVTDFSNWLDQLVNGKQQLYIGGWTTASGDPSEAFDAMNSANFGSGGNRSFYSNSEADKLINTIDTSTDDNTRKTACVDLQKLLGDECVTVNMNDGVNFYAVSKSISNFKPSQTQRCDFTAITFAAK